MSNYRCSVAHCPNKSGKLAPDVVCFSIPSDAAGVAQWVAATNYPWKAGAKVCSAHFDVCDLISTKNNSVRLLKGAIPTKILLTNNDVPSAIGGIASPTTSDLLSAKKRRATISATAHAAAEIKRSKNDVINRDSTLVVAAAAIAATENSALPKNSPSPAKVSRRNGGAGSKSAGVFLAQTPPLTSPTKYKFQKSVEAMDVDNDASDDKSQQNGL